MMLFLGAGASKPFGIKTMEEMSEEFENIVDSFSENEEKLYKNICKTLGTNNLEHMLTVLNDLINDTPSIRYCGFYINKAHLKFLVDLLTGGDGEYHREICEYLSLREKENPEALKSKIIEFIRNECNIDEKIKRNAPIKAEIENKYASLFEILENCSSPFNIFTTNYDGIIENYFENEDKFYDGFTCTDPRICDWQPEGYDKNYKFKLFKLHGSVDQYIENGRISKCWRELRGVENAMIYPMREKEVYKDPFFELFTRLKSSLADKETKVCIVIGYSFSDEHIRNIFFDAVKRNAKIGIILVSPNAKKIRDDLEYIKDEIVPIEGEFGEESVFEELEEKLNEWECI